jgi:3(or 17)beta-hydroxysteroid dehydrogenase
MKRRAAWVTGAASGIGRAAAVLFGARGLNVLCLDIDAAGCAATAEAVRAAGGHAIAQALDVADEAGWEAVAGRVRDEVGRLDVAVHSAGISRIAPVAATSLADWRRVMAVNLDGTFLGTRVALGLMRHFGNGGSIVNVSSASGLRAVPEASAYCASKAAVNMLTRVAARECLAANEPIRVNSVCPGAVKTPIWRGVPFFQGLVAKAGSEEAAFASLTGRDRFAEPEEIARAIWYLASDEASYVTGTELVIDNGYLA